MVDTSPETEHDENYRQFSKYLAKEFFTDVTLVSDDLQKFEAHKIILSAASPVLEKLLISCMQVKDGHTILPLRGYNRYEVQGVLNFIYSKKTANDTLKNHGVKRLLKELKIKVFSKRESSPTFVTTFKSASVQEIRKEFEILNRSNIALDTVKSIEPEDQSSVVPEVNEILDQKDIKSTIIFEGQECPIVNVSDNYSENGVTYGKSNDDEMLLGDTDIRTFVY